MVSRENQIAKPKGQQHATLLLCRLLTGIFHKDDNGKVVNPTGIGVFVTKTGSMTKERFPDFCTHFVKNLLKNNVYCLCLPGHTSIWSQPGRDKCGSSEQPPAQTA